tara:strand:+ start:6155 stop:7057 length:903 start_codon:yes stop_codon:yes gene_type:complete
MKMTNIAFPYLSIPDNLIVKSHWTQAGSTSETKILVDNWDYQKDIRLIRTVKLSFSEIAEHLSIPEDELRLKICIQYGTGQGRLPRLWLGTTSYDVDSTNQEIQPELFITGSKLSSRIFIETSVVLAAVPENPGPLSPVKFGNIVWNDSFDIKLEPDDSLFPVEAISFNSMFRGKLFQYAPWYLHFEPGSPHRDISNAVRLYVNTDNIDFFDNFIKKDSYIIQSVMASVIGQIVYYTIANNSFVDDKTQYGENTVGSYVLYWVEQFFPQSSIRNIKDMTELLDPGAFWATIYANMDKGLY